MLHLTLGCMYSGKTSALIRDASQGGLIIDYDTGGEAGVLYNHDNVKIRCETMKTLASVKTSSTSIFINEAQFFDGLVEFVKEMLKQGKHIHVYGLDGDFRQQKFGSILDLIPMADTYTKLYAICKCGDNASFSKRLSSSTTQYGPDDRYIPVCRACL
jgi:thymidine kinase